MVRFEVMTSLIVVQLSCRKHRRNTISQETPEENREKLHEEMAPIELFRCFKKTTESILERKIKKAIPHQ